MSRRLVLAAVVVVLLAVPGCGPTQPASFRLNLPKAMETVDPAQGYVEPWKPWAWKRQRQVATILEAMFGTPDEPVVLPETGLDEAKIRRAAGPVRSDLDGRKNGLYREHCAHCHGISGDGMGPTAAFLNPYPRDYRRGIFKFKSTLSSYKPTHADLVKILHDGIVGTSMPSFALLSPAEIDALAEYVKYLAIRGETELLLYDHIKEEDVRPEGELPVTRDFLIDEKLVKVAKKWQQTPDIPVAPVPAGIDFALGADHPANKESIARGRSLFHAGTCKGCHGPTALGDGRDDVYDVWNEPLKDARKDAADSLRNARKVSIAELKAEKIPEHEARIAWLEERARVLEGDTLAPRTIPPRNLRHGLYRGGRRPIDIYRRIYTGINGANMPGVATDGGTGNVPDEDIWHIVNYVLSLPYEFDGELGADRVMAAKDRF